MADLQEREEESSRSPKRKLCQLNAAESNLTLRSPALKTQLQYHAEHLYSCAKEHVWERYFSTISVSSHIVHPSIQRLSRPCPACSRPISLSQAANDENSDKAFEVQRIIPWGAGADREVDNWNLVPLCSRHHHDIGVEDVDNQGQEQEQAWGCSERLERAGDIHAFDWMRLNYPQRLQEMCMRLQLAHGESFALPAGETLCLRFVRDVYGEGRARIRSHVAPTPAGVILTTSEAETEQGDTNRRSTEEEVKEEVEVDPASRHGEWARRQVGFNSDILDLAECFSEMTDREMLRVIEMKTKLATPRVARRRLSSASTGTGARTALAPTPLTAPSGRYAVASLSSVGERCKGKNVSRQKVERALFVGMLASNKQQEHEQERQPDSDDDSDYRSADSDDESDSEDAREQEIEQAPSLKRLRSGSDVDCSLENRAPNTILSPKSVIRE